MPRMPGRAARQPELRRGVARVVEAHAVDDGALADEPERARARIAGLRLRRDGARLGEAEAHGEQGVVDARVLVVASRHADGVGEGEAEQRLAKARIVRLACRGWIPASSARSEASCAVSGSRNRSWLGPRTRGGSWLKLARNDGRRHGKRGGLRFSPRQRADRIKMGEEIAAARGFPTKRTGPSHPVPLPGRRDAVAPSPAWGEG